MIPQSIRGHLILCTIAVVTIGLGFLIWLNVDHDAPVLLLIGVAGAFGGLMNVYKRSTLLPGEQGAEAQPSELAELTTFRIYMSPIVGGLLSVTLYMVFLSGLVSGELFPEFADTDKTVESPATFMRSMVPETNGDLAKAVFWGFVAGFSQRFVLSVLSSAVRKGGGSGGGQS